ncbi:kynureninase [Streptomyces sp. NBC_01221]|uniref:kynureninase n=1 Tax=Streptomyces sp. NBC_01221 TaxID=2903782 RepID=UPI0022556109|nr:kynureninase [Streptomyces sp. NBC_01221]MCX4792316.1 kynureninase [Streptomyces sp. NBC_01221]
MTTFQTPEQTLLARAHQLDEDDPLAAYRAAFLEAPDSDLVAYLDGNSLGRPLRATAERMDRFIRGQWAGRLIRGWTDEWLAWPERLGDRIAAAALGAAPGQVVVADSTTVLLYKLVCAAVDARPGRCQIVVDHDNFPTDRYVVEAIARVRGLELVWIRADLASGVTLEQVAEVVSDRTALVLLSHVAYRSGWMADGPAITRIAHDAGALVLWDLSHSAGSVELALDAWGADLAAGCTYKYLNGGPGAPAFGYVNRALQAEFRQPIWGWMGRRDSFAMAAGYEPADGIRSLLSGTPAILAMVPLSVSLEILEEVGTAAVRRKSVALTEYAVELLDTLLGGAELLSPRDPERRGGHVTIRKPGARDVVAKLWDEGVIPDYREPDGIRIGLAPLSTSFEEVYHGVTSLCRQLGSGACR